MSKDGPHRNVLKGKPPMVITKKDMDHFIDTLDQVLTELEDEMEEEKQNEQ